MTEDAPQRVPGAAPMCCASGPEVSADGAAVTVKPCGVGVAPGRLMCDAHWALVPGEVRRLLIEEQKLAKQRGLKRPTDGWRELARMAVLAVWKELVQQLQAHMQAVLAAKQAGSVAADAAPTKAEALPGSPEPADG